jgi:hypothetical protein
MSSSGKSNNRRHSIEAAAPAVAPIGCAGAADKVKFTRQTTRVGAGLISGRLENL